MRFDRAFRNPPMCTASRFEALSEDDPLHSLVDWRRRFLTAVDAHGDRAIRQASFERARARFRDAGLARLQAFERGDGTWGTARIRAVLRLTVVFRHSR
jgi:hypothetical protein